MIIIKKEGDVTPRVAAADPQNPPTLYPTKVAVFMAMGPGSSAKWLLYLGIGPLRASGGCL